MAESQGWHLIGIAWLAMAAFNKPIDIGSLLYVFAAICAFMASWRTDP